MGLPENKLGLYVGLQWCLMLPVYIVNYLLSRNKMSCQSVLEGLSLVCF